MPGGASERKWKKRSESCSHRASSIYIVEATLKSFLFFLFFLICAEYFSPALEGGGRRTTNTTAERGCGASQFASVEAFTKECLLRRHRDKPIVARIPVSKNYEN